MLYDYSKVKHLGGYDVKADAVKAQNALKSINIPDQGQNYANGHLVYNKRYASYVWFLWTDLCLKLNAKL